jgi:peptide/nickel transport system ATP-binding protein/oligopeptide transport system ATP-binding protein
VTNHTLEVRNLKTHFYTSRGIIPAVDGVSFHVPKGKITGLVGESGCGKSVTSLSVMGLVSSPGRIVEGEILFEGTDLARKTPREMCSIRGKDLSMIFQEPMTSLNPVHTVGKQVGEVLRLHTSMKKKERRDAVVHMLDLVGIPEPSSRCRCYPHQLSGGLRQRVMIAMALICEPKLLIADEPTTALDVTIQAQILQLMLDLLHRIHTSIILITHDLGVVAEVCDYVNVMYAGKVVESARVFELFENPMHPYTQGLLRSIPSIENGKERQKLYTIEGSVPSMLHLPRGCAFAPRCDRALPRCFEEAPELENREGEHGVRCWRASKVGGSAA